LCHTDLQPFSSLHPADPGRAADRPKCTAAAISSCAGSEELFDTPEEQRMRLRTKFTTSVALAEVVLSPLPATAATA
jgi:hypothetical protein